MKDIENPMVIDSLWHDQESQPPVIGEYVYLSWSRR